MELLDNVSDTTHDYWVELQIEDLKLHPNKVMDKLIRKKGVTPKEAYTIVNRVYKIVRKRTARKQLLIGTNYKRWDFSCNTLVCWTCYVLIWHP